MEKKNQIVKKDHKIKIAEAAMLCVHTSAFDSCAGGVTVLWADSALCKAQYESAASQHPPQDTPSPSVQAEAGKSLILPC